MLFSLEAIVDRIEGGKAVLEIPENPKIKLPFQTVIWPKSALPPNVREGDVVTIGLLKSEDAVKEKEAVAKSLLNALLKKADEQDISEN